MLVNLYIHIIRARYDVTGETIISGILPANEFFFGGKSLFVEMTVTKYIHDICLLSRL